MPDVHNKTTQIKNNKHNKVLRIALAGNPNCGKTTLFNQLTGSRQYVGNWPGVTVEKKEGIFKNKDLSMRILDLPGVYSLSPYSPEEIITRNCLVNEAPNLIINIVDATNLERNLYLTTQILELNKPTVIAVNMIDIIESYGYKVDFKLLSQKLGVPVVPISASKGVGINELMALVNSYVNSNKKIESKNIYPEDIELVLSEIINIISDKESLPIDLKRWAAIKIFEDDKLVLKNIKLTNDQKKKIEISKNKIKTSKNVDHQMIIAECRYKYISNICKSALKLISVKSRYSLTEKIDRIVTNRYLSLPLFFFIMLSIFYVTFGPFGTFLKDYVEQLIKVDFSGLVSEGLFKLGASDWANSLIVGGVINGVGSVISFFPQITILFFLLSILEDSGYMARAAFIMDGLLRKIGLSGKAFVPMLMGFGCTVPAIMGTRILEKERDKRLAILITPFMSCSAKMPVYSMFIAVFFSNHKTLVMFSIYILGIIIAILSSLLFKNTILKGQESPFIMELPEYRFPNIKNLILHVWERVKDFLTKAGTVLVGATIVIWFLQSFDFGFKMVSNSENSILAQIGAFIAPIFTFCGFSDWKMSVSLLTGIIAKESIVSTMAILYTDAQTSSLSLALSSQITPIAAYSIMVFILLYTPCIAALSTINKELKSFKWMSFIALYQFVVALFVSALVFQFSSLAFKIF